MPSRKGDAPALPSKIDDLQKEKAYKGWTWAVVDADLSKLGTKARVNITLPDVLPNNIG